MINKKSLIKYLNKLHFKKTNHGSGRKKVFLSNNDTHTALTQFAYGEFNPGERCERHSHPTMEECFYFISGSGTYIVGDDTYKLSAESFLRIPAGTPHELRCADEPLKFVYVGLATIIYHYSYHLTPEE